MIENAPGRMTDQARARYTPGTPLVPPGQYLAFFPGQGGRQGHYLAIDVARTGEVRVADQAGERHGIRALEHEMRTRGNMEGLWRIGGQR